MPEYCTCGAQLPPDAVFCHKCGKPQREIAPAEPTPPPPPVYIPPAYGVLPPPPPAPARQAMPVSFRNPIALRTALYAALAGGLISVAIPLVGFGGAGFFSVFFYRRATRGRVNVATGMRMGWLTGIIMFTMWGLLIVFLGVTGVFSTHWDQFSKAMALSPNDQSIKQVGQLLGTPSGLLVFLVVTFVLIVCISVAGAAIAAKSVGGDS